MGHGLNPFDAPPRVFISYARSDGAELASSLRERLEREHPEITLWLDRAQMLGGIGWWKQITEALDEVQILIMILTPAAVRSDIAAKEWRYARQQGVRVCPVMKQGANPEFDALPNWMRKVHCYDFDKEWETFTSFLLSAGRESRVPFMAPDLPENYVERPVQTEALLGRLLDESGENPQFVTVALQGSGGVGKTTLASILCHNENIINSFDDGILWVRLGETPNIQMALTKLYAALTGERPAFVDIDDASIQLADRLDQKNCLLVVDDVWDPNHLKPFMRGGSQCARLITTRQLSVVTEVQATRTIVDKMTEDQAVSMLTACISYSPDDYNALRALAQRLGEWPLLLKLAGSQLRKRMARGDSLGGALAYVGRAMDKRGIVAFDRVMPGARHDAIASTVGASLELFPAGDRARCAELAIFRNDVLVPLSAASVLWNLDEFDTEDLILRLDDASLLEFDLKIGGIRLHNVIQSYLGTQLESVEALHARLIEQWLRTPYELPDAYAWTWIGWHLAQAGEHERLRQLLLDYRWLKTRLASIPVQALLQDFDLLEGPGDIRVVRDALRLASHGLSFDPDQLGAQLGGRLDRGGTRAVDKLLDTSNESETGPRLVLADTSLSHPGGALTGILKAHGGVMALAVSPDGQSIISGSEDWNLHLWNLQTNRVVRTFEGHSGVVHTVVFTPDGQSILSGSEDRTLRLWDVDTGELKWLFRGHRLAVQGVAIAADGKIAASVSEDGTVRLWNLESKQPPQTVFKGAHHQLNTVVISRDGGKLLFGAGDWTIRLIDLVNHEEKTLEGHSGVVRCLALTASETRVLSGSDDASLRVWALDSGESPLELLGHAGSVDSIAVSPDETWMVSGSHDKTLRVWNLQTGEVLRILEGHAGFVRTIAISPITNRVISGSTDKTIRYWNAESAPIDQPCGGHAKAVTLLAISADGTRVTSGTRSGDLLVWYASADKGEGDSIGPDGYAAAPRVTGRMNGHADYVRVLKMTADGRRAVTGSGLADRTSRIWDLERAVCTQVLKGHTREILDLEISTDGARVITLSRDRTVRLWDAETGQNMRVLVSADNERALSSLLVGDAMLAELDIGPQVDIADKPIPRDQRIALSPDGSHVLLLSQGNICDWNLDNGSIRNQGLQDLDIVSVAFDPSSESVVLGSLFGALLAWDFKRVPSILEGHTGRVLDLVVTADGKSAISAARDDTIRIWDLDSGEQRAQLTGPAGKVDTVAIAPNGHFAYSIYGDTLIAHDLNALSRLASLSFDHLITTLAVTPSGKRLAIGDQSGRVHFLHLRS